MIVIIIKLKIIIIYLLFLVTLRFGLFEFLLSFINSVVFNRKADLGWLAEVSWRNWWSGCEYKQLRSLLPALEVEVAPNPTLTVTLWLSRTVSVWLWVTMWMERCVSFSFTLVILMRLMPNNENLVLVALPSAQHASLKFLKNDIIM